MLKHQKYRDENIMILQMMSGDVILKLLQYESTIIVSNRIIKILKSKSCLF